MEPKNQFTVNLNLLCGGPAKAVTGTGRRLHRTEDVLAGEKQRAAERGAPGIN